MGTVGEHTSIYRMLTRRRIMRRREYLGLVGASSLPLLAGCSSGDSQPTTELPVFTATSSSGNAQSTPTKTTQTTTQSPQEASIEFVNTDYILANSVVSNQEIPWGIVDVENTTQNPHGMAQLEIRFYDADDNLLEARSTAYINFIPAGTTWRHYTRYYTETPENVDSVEARIVENQPQVTGSTIEGELLNSNLDVDPEAGIDFVAEVDIGDTDIDRIVAIGLFYDDAGLLRGSIRDVTTNPTQSVAVSSGNLVRTPPELEDKQVTDFELYLFTGFLSA